MYSHIPSQPTSVQEIRGSRKASVPPWPARRLLGRRLLARTLLARTLLARRLLPWPARMFLPLLFLLPSLVSAGETFCFEDDSTWDADAIGRHNVTTPVSRQKL